MKLFNEYEQYDAIGLAKLIKQKEISPSELLETAIAKVEKHNPAVNSVITKMYEAAKKSIKNGIPAGPFQGVPFLLKDLGVHYKGVGTRNSSSIFNSSISDHDSEITLRYKNAGLLIFGKTNTPELGLTVTTEPKMHGPTRNPWDLNRTTGGSSGGAAAAVASGMVPVAHGSDAGGSIRIPASCCGVFGLKPSRGRVIMGSEFGQHWSGMNTQHVLSRSVRDSAAFLDVISSTGLGEPYHAPPPERPFLEEVGRDPGKLRIAYTAIPSSGKQIDPSCKSALDSAINLCEKLGHDVEEAAPAIDEKSLSKASSTILCANAYSALKAQGKILGRDITPEDVEPVTWHSSEIGKKLNSGAYVFAEELIHKMGREIAPFYEKFDILLSPVLLQPPVLLGTIDTQAEIKDYAKALFNFFGFTNIFNATGQPAMSVPLYWTEQDLPIGLQFSTKFGDEALLFRLAAQLEEARPWSQKRPQL